MWLHMLALGCNALFLVAVVIWMLTQFSGMLTQVRILLPWRMAIEKDEWDECARYEAMARVTSRSFATWTMWPLFGKAWLDREVARVLEERASELGKAVEEQSPGGIGKLRVILGEGGKEQGGQDVPNS